MTEIEPASDEIDPIMIQRRTIRVLFVAVLPAGAAQTAAVSAAALTGKEITNSGFLGTVAAACLTMGTAIAAIPVARHMELRGRRSGLRRSWLVAAAGAVLAFAAALTDLYPLLLLGSLAMGAGNAGTLAARYAAADLADDASRARAIGILVWAGSFGSVLGPSIGLGWAGTTARWLGLPKLTGPYFLAVCLFSIAALWIERQLHPDPLVASGALPTGATTTPPLTATPAGRRDAVIAHLATSRRALALIVANPTARLAVSAMVIGHGVMVAVMTAAPLHMEDGDHKLQIIGFAISLHIVGMYFFAPIVGVLVDRLGPTLVIITGGLIVFAGAEISARTTPHSSAGIFAGLFAIGLGWSFGLIAGSSMLTAAFEPHERVGVQGAADLTMSAAGAFAALSGGLVYELVDFGSLSRYSGLLALVLALLGTWSLLRPSPKTPRHV